MGRVSSSSAPVIKDTGRIQVQTASETIGSAGTVTLVSAANNPAGLLLWSLSISSAASGTGLGSGFITEDTVNDTDGNQYLACQIAMAGTVSGEGENAANSVAQDMNGILVPAGAALQLNNGGAGGTMALRQCSATVIYTTLQ